MRSRDQSARLIFMPRHLPALAGEWEINGVVEIANEKRIAWHRIRAEYITGVSQRKLAAKYNVPRSAIERHSRLENWTEQREAAKAKVQEKVVQKTAEAVAENAVRAQRIKTRLLEKLEALMEEQLRATEERRYDDDKLVEVHRLRDLTAAYKDLTGDMPRAEAGEEVLQQAREILGGVSSVID